MSDPILLRDDAAGVCTLTLNRPQARNALSRPLMAALQEALDVVAADASIKVVVLAANGPAFCAGHDLKEVRGLSQQEHLPLFEQCSRLMTTIVHLPKPVIAKVHAMATAAGCQLVASCDLAYAAQEARFATPGVNIGLFCSTPMVALSRAVGRKKAMEMLLSGRPISAAEAEAAGLINHAVAAADLDAVVADIAGTIASKSPLTLAIGKEAFYRQVEMPLEDAYAYASEVMARNMAARDAAEGIDAFIEKRPPVWQGC
ncbi:enoyl-CoA hydratase [Novispirillum sp. DQ9]|uniref:enoyl-CoA hydratase n=1 Tax=Novispirillum sp. DQ9 TaxID=3398612 RepID=UPI003C7EC48B